MSKNTLSPDYGKSGDDDFPVVRRRRNQSWSAIDLHEYKVYTGDSSAGKLAANASTQTDDKRRRRRSIIREEDEGDQYGKDNPGFSLISHYKSRMLPRVRNTGSEEATVEDAVVLRKNRRIKKQIVTEDKEYFSGSLIETKREPFPALKRSNSYTGNRLQVQWLLALAILWQPWVFLCAHKIQHLQGMKLSLDLIHPHWRIDTLRLNSEDDSHNDGVNKFDELLIELSSRYQMWPLSKKEFATSMINKLLTEFDTLFELMIRRPEG
ncbi:unnamed protein product [Lactuca virosa]|uniref:Uncharacterized protein n=1 Tax=Lactuca virosa TaxID=75947 RepID=A0AAU9P5I1_9ASTR|nr:unnamed protein product [Lactuca virosa]